MTVNTDERVEATQPSSDRLTRFTIDLIVLAVLALATLVTHPWAAMFRHPYWFDEAWVAALTRAPWSRFTRLSSSTPLGFVTLLRLVPGSGLQRHRIVVLGFAILTTLATYVCVRSLAWTSATRARCVATAAGLAVMLAPISLRRNDLKQYTCDAFCAMVLLALGNWVERSRSSWRALLFLLVASIVVVPFSTTALFVVAAVFAGLVASAVLARERAMVRRVIVVAAAAGCVIVVYFFVAIQPNLNAKLKAFWASSYLTGSLPHAARLAVSHFGAISTHVATPAWIFLALGVLGVAFLVRMRSFVLAAAVPALWFEMLVAGRMQRYPFLDLRTSYFLLVPSVVVAVLGVVFVLELIASRAGTLAAVGAAVVAVVLFAGGALGSVRQLGIFHEDVRAETLAVADRVTPRDTIVVGASAVFGFAYYWPHAHIVFSKTDNNGQGFTARVSGRNNVFYVPSDRGADILQTLRAAVERWRRFGPGARLYIVRTHLLPGYNFAWGVALKLLGQKFESVNVGPEPLLVARS